MTPSIFSLAGQVAVVTGGASGIGKALSLGLAAAGADVVPTSRREAEVAATAAEVRALGRRSLSVTSDATGTLRACQAFGPAMLERGYGRIVNIASLNSFVSFHEVTAYAASKAAVAALTRSLAVEWSARGVTVNAIAPGVFRTDFNQKLLDGTERGRELLMRTPMKRFGKFEELVGAAVFFASAASSFVNGQILAVDGGFLASGV